MEVVSSVTLNRIKLKDSKVLQEIPAFKMLKKEEVNVIIDAMAHIVR